MARVPGSKNVAIANLLRGTCAEYTPIELYLLSVLDEIDEHHPIIDRLSRRGVVVNFDELAAVETLGDEQVYWAPFGKVYHTHEDCSSLNQSETLTVGTVEQAIASGRTRLCYFCAQQDNITGVTTDAAE
jgi:hypothetical protein